MYIQELMSLSSFVVSQGTKAMGSLASQRSSSWRRRDSLMVLMSPTLRVRMTQAEREELDSLGGHFLLASDGVWEFLSNEDVAKIVHSASTGCFSCGLCFQHRRAVGQGDG